MERQDWDRKWRDERPEPRTDPNRFLVAEVDEMAPGRALDLACGAGRNAIWLAERGWEVTAVDFSEVALQKARRLASGREVEIELILADLRAWAPPAACFDLVVVLYLQLPAKERRAVLSTAASAVAPGGIVLVVGHHVDNLTKGYGGPKSTAVLFTEHEVADELLGLVIVRAERVARTVKDEDGTHVALDALVKATRPRA